MNQVISSSQNIYSCCYEDHKDKEILGLCLNIQCKNESAFCLKCLTSEDQNIHKGHKNQCKEFQDLYLIIYQSIQNQAVTENDLMNLTSEYIKQLVDVTKLITYKSDLLELKLQKIITKVQSINLEIMKRKQVLEILIESLESQNYEKIKQGINLLKKISIWKIQFNLFERIGKISAITYSEMHQKMTYRNVIGLIDKAATLYFQKVKKQYSQAIHLFDEAILRKPQSVENYRFKGNALQEINQFEESIKCYNQAIRLDLKDATSFNQKGHALYKQLNLKKLQIATIKQFNIIQQLTMYFAIKEYYQQSQNNGKKQ